MGDMDYTSVRHVSKDHIVILPAPGWSMTLFDAHGEDAIEATVVRDDGTETILLLIAAPGPGRTMSIERETGGFINIRYSDV
jgi:hypothetical protein